MKINCEIELSRNNVTPAQFLAYVRGYLIKKGIRHYASDLDLDYFQRGNDFNFYYHDDPEKPCKAEKSISKPYQMQTFVLNWDGSRYNEIVEFEFDDDTRGHGYYYLINTETETETKEVNTMSKYTHHTHYFYGNEVSAYGQELGYVDYRTLAKAFDAVLNNEVIAKTQEVGYWDIVNGCEYDEETDEYTEIFQYYIISDQGAEILTECTEEIVFYNETLDMYVWGVTHYGTSWDYVLTDIKIEMEVGEDA